MDLKKFFSELERRKVYKAAIAYGISAWVIAQIAGLVSASFEFPSWVMKMIIILLIIGFITTMVLSWIFDIGPKGIERTEWESSDLSDEKKPITGKLVISSLILLSVFIGTGWWTWQELVVNNTKPIKSLAVLPFDNYTGNDELEYFVAGMHSSLIGDIQKISALRVPGTTSSNSFKDAKMSIPEIASALNVDALIEASVSCIEGDSVCIQIRLVRVYPEEQQLWVQDYYEDKSQILNLYNRVTKQISEEVNVILTPKEENLLAESRTVDPDAYEAYLKGQNHTKNYSKESLYKALDYLNSAIEKEPDWALPYAGLANAWLGIQQMGYEPPSVASPKIYENLNKAIELDPDLSDAHGLSGLIAHVMEWDWEKSEREYLKALAINPNDAQSRVLYAQLLCILQRPDEGLAQGRLALDLDPLNPSVKGWYAAVLIFVGDFKTALVLEEEIRVTDPESYLASAGIQIAAFLCKEYDKLINAERYFLRMYNVKEEDIQEIDRIFNEQGVVKAYEKTMKHLEEVSKNYPISPFDMATRYIYANQPDKAMDWLEKGFELHEPTMTYIAVTETFAPLFNNPRFISIVEKMNLPMPENYQTTKNKRN